MPLTVTNYFRNIYTGDDITGWTYETATGFANPNIALNTEHQLEGTGCIALKCDTTPIMVWGPSFSPIDMSVSTGNGTQLFMWMNIYNYLDLAYHYELGACICVEDINGAQACYYVLTKWNASWDVFAYYGGWILGAYNISAPNAPNWDNGLTIDKTQIVKVGARFLMHEASPSLTHNIFLDKCFVDIPTDSPLGRGGYIVTGTNNTDGSAWEELYDISDSQNLGILTKKGGSVYLLHFPLCIGDLNQTENTRFIDYGSQVFVDKPTRAAAQYPGIFTYSNSSFSTTFQVGEKLTTIEGDSGVNGLVLGGTANTEIVFNNRIGDNPNTLGGWYGILSPNNGAWGASTWSLPNYEYINVQFEPQGRMLFGSARVENCTFYNCPSLGSFGAVGYGGSTTETTFKNNIFLNNDTAISIDAAGTYVFDNLQFYNNTIDVLNRSGGDLIIDCINGSNPDPVKVSNPNGGSVTFRFPNTLTINIKDTNGNPLSGIEVSIVRASDRTVLFNVENTDATGSVTYSYSTIETVDILFNAPGYKPIISDKYDYTLPSQNTTLEITLFDDENYNNPV